MKKIGLSILVFVLIMGASSMVYAYSYSFDFQSGGISLSVSENCTLLTLVTAPSDMVVDFTFDPAPSGELMNYTASMDMTLGLFGMFNYDLVMPDLTLGSFQGIDPTAMLVGGNHTFNDTISGEFGGYVLTDATLNYDFTITPDDNITDRYAINIADLSLTGGNTSELLSGIINELNQTGEIPITLSVPFTIPTTLSGTLNIEADPVPLPAGIWLLGSGLLGLIGYRKRKRPA